MTVDHIIPKHKGGKDSWAHLVAACVPCNTKKGNKLLKDINMTIQDGEKIGIVGNIGSGNTTMLRSIIGYYLPSKGTINLSGYDLQNIPSKSLRNHIGYCPQNS